jgi:hypothetical protein
MVYGYIMVVNRLRIEHEFVASQQCNRRDLLQMTYPDFYLNSSSRQSYFGDIKQLCENTVPNKKHLWWTEGFVLRASTGSVTLKVGRS